jgi:hypothetical protein
VKSLVPAILPVNGTACLKVPILKEYFPPVIEIILSYLFKYHAWPAIFPGSGNNIASRYWVT